MIIMRHETKPNVLLLYPKTGMDIGSTVAPPHALLTVAAPLLKAGYNVKLLDQRTHHITEKDIPSIAEVNSDKFGCFTPGTHIPIISEEEAKAQKPDYLMVLPWHFRDNIIFRENQYLKSGGKFLFPLPTLEVYPQ